MSINEIESKARELRKFPERMGGGCKQRDPFPAPEIEINSIIRQCRYSVLSDFLPWVRLGAFLLPVE